MAGRHADASAMLSVIVNILLPHLMWDVFPTSCVRVPVLSGARSPPLQSMCQWATSSVNDVGHIPWWYEFERLACSSPLARMSALVTPVGHGGDEPQRGDDKEYRPDRIEVKHTANGWI